MKSKLIHLYYTLRTGSMTCISLQSDQSYVLYSHSNIRKYIYVLYSSSFHKQSPFLPKIDTYIFFCNINISIYIFFNIYQFGFSFFETLILITQLIKIQCILHTQLSSNVLVLTFLIKVNPKCLVLVLFNVLTNFHRSLFFLFERY